MESVDSIKINSESLRPSFEQLLRKVLKNLSENNLDPTIVSGYCREILDFLMESVNYSQSKELFLEFSDLFKAVFLKIQIFLLESNTLEMFDLNFKDLLRIFTKICGNKEIDLFTNLLILLLIKQNLFYFRHAGMVLEYINKCIETKEELGDICIIPIIFCREICDKSFLNQEKWLEIWDRVTKIMDVDEVCVQVIISVKNFGIDTSFIYFCEFLTVCQNNYQEIVVGLAKHKLIDCFLELISLRKEKKIGADDLVKCIGEIIKYPEAVQIHIKLLKLCMNDSLKLNKVFRKHYFICLPNGIKTASQTEIDEFFAILSKETELGVVNGILQSFNAPIPESIQKKILDKKIFLVLWTVLKNSSYGKVVKFWISFFRFLHFFTDFLALTEDKSLKKLVFELRKDCFKSHREQILNESLRDILYLHSQCKDFFWIVLEFLLYPVQNSFIEEYSGILTGFKLKTCRFKHISKIEDAILYHLHEINDKHWPIFSKLLIKCFKYKVSCKLIKKVENLALRSKPRIAIRLLNCIKSSLESTYLRDNIIRKFTYFTEHSYFEVNNPEGLFSCRGEFSIVFWLYPSRTSKNCCLLEFSDNNSSKFYVKLKNSKIFTKGITNKTVFEAESTQEVLISHWNYVAISMNFKPKAEIVIELNSETTKTIFQSKINFDITIFSMILGCNIDKSESFKGKIASLQIYKRSLASDEIKELFCHPKINSIFMEIKKDSSKTLRLKTELVFLYSGSESEPFIAFKPNFVFKNFQVVFCNGKSWYSAFKCVCLEDWINFNGHEEFLGVLEMLSVLFMLPEVGDLVPKYFAESITYKAVSFNINFEVKKGFLRFIMSVCLKAMKEKLLFYYLNESSLHYFKDPTAVEDADMVVIMFKELYRRDYEKFLWLSKAFSGVECTNISYLLRHFIEDFCNRVKFSKVLKILIKSENFGFIEAIISLVESCDFDCPCEEFLNVLLMMLTHPLSIPFQKGLTKMIYKEINSKFEVLKKRSNKSLDDALNFIKQRFTGFDALVECLIHFGLKSLLFNSELKQTFLDTVLLKTRYSENPQTIQKLLTFLSENPDSIHSFIYSRSIFPYWLCDLYRIKPEFSLSLAETIFYNLGNYEDLTKIDYFFRNINANNEALEIYEKLIWKFSDTVYSKNSEKLAEIVIILEIFNPKQVFSIKYCNIIQGILDLYSNSNFLFISPFINGEFSPLPSKHALRILLKVCLRAVRIDSSSILCLKKLLILTKYFKTIGTQGLDGKSIENNLILYTFCLLSEIIYSSHTKILNFFENFLVKVKIKQQLTWFFDKLAVEDIEKCSNLMQNNTFVSTGKKFINLEHNNPVVLNPQIRKNLISTLDDSNPLGQICLSDWIIQIHYTLIILIVLPFKSTDYRPKPIHQRDSESEPALNYIKQFEEILNTVTLENFNIEKEMKKNFIKTVNLLNSKEKNKRINQIESLLDGKYFIKNRTDQMHRWSLLKLTDKVFELDNRISTLYQESIQRSISLHDIDSRLFNSTLYCVIDWNVTLSNNQNYVRVECEQIKISGSFFGIATFTSKFFELKFSKSIKSQEKYFGSALIYTAKSKKKHVVYKIDQISEVLSRRFIHKNSAVEIYLVDGKSYFLNFFSKSSKEEVFKIVSKWQTVRVFQSIPFTHIQGYRERWSLGQISTLEYLLVLNKYAGRSFHDLSQYPVFPWVITNFFSPGLNPDDPAIYRDFHYPIGAQTSEKRQEVIKKSNISMDNIGKYHFGQHYSNGGIVLYYLFRLEPFSTQMKILQEGKFDHPDRTFFSFECSWDCSQLNTGDSKELVPELFYLPQALENLNFLNIGENRKFGRDSGEFVFPPWAKNSWDFVRKHRKCLESVHCSSKIHNWIDLVFGFKQNGLQAEGACNLFHPFSYQEFYKKYLKQIDSLEHKCVIDQIYHFGQTPCRIFNEPHGKRKFLPYQSIFEAWKSELGVCNKAVGYSRVGQYLTVLASQKYLFIFCIIGTQIYFNRLEITEKSLGKCKDFHLKRSKISDFCKPVLDLYNNFIVSGGYLDASLHFADDKGELMFILTQHPSPTISLHSSSQFLFSGSHSLLSLDSGLQKTQFFSGHKSQIISIHSSDSLNIVVSCDSIGNILLHDTRTTEYIYSLKQVCRKVLISELGFFIAFSQEFFNCFTFDGKILSKVDVFYNESALINQFGDMVMISCFGKIVCVDIFDVQTFEVVIGDFRGFCVPKDEKCVYAISCIKESLKLEIFVQNNVKKNKG